MAETTPSNYDRVVQLLNDAQSGETHSLNYLRQVKEVIVHQEPDLLDNFLDEVLAFMNDRNPDIRKFVLGFIEDACKNDTETLPKVLPNLNFLIQSDENQAVQKRIILAISHLYPIALKMYDTETLPKVLPNLNFLIQSDENQAVQKRIILAISHLYPIALKWMGSVKQPSGKMETSWAQLRTLKDRVVPLIDGDNDGIRTHAIKFLEATILAQSSKTPNSESKADSFCLNLVPRDHGSLSYRQLEGEGKSLFKKLVELLALDHITAVNLMTTMGVLANIARQRPELAMSDTIAALETLHVNLPPTLAKSQVSSTRKALKMHLLQILKHPSSAPFHPQITTLLTDLGATQTQVLKALPAGSELRKRMRRDRDGGGSGETGEPVVKRKKDEEEDGEDEEEKGGAAVAIDVTAAWIHPRLVPEAVVQLVMWSMGRLPELMPASFQANFTPIAAAGTEAQKTHLSRLLGTQLTAAGLGPGAEEERRRNAAKAAKAASAAANAAANPISAAMAKTSSAYHTNESASTSGSEAAVPAKLQAIPVYGVPTGSKGAKRFHQMGLVHMTRPMDGEQIKRMLELAFTRIIGVEKRAMQGGAGPAQATLLVRMAARFDVPALQETLLGYVLADQKTRSDLAIAWVYEAYLAYLGFCGRGPGAVKEAKAELLNRYDRCLSTFLSILFSRGEHKDSLFHKLLLEAPWITPSALELLKQACVDSVYGTFCLNNTLRELIIARPRQRGDLLNILLEFTMFEQASFRGEALGVAREVSLASPAIASEVKAYAVDNQLNLLLQPSPPALLFGKERGRPEAREGWSEETIKACLYLSFHLLAQDPSLIHQLASVYVHSSAEIKRVILRQLDLPVKAIGIDSPELLKLVQECPEGSETLVTRIVHLLTERSPPTKELVAKVKELYNARVPDVRCLIPVLTGLTKEEILEALPKLINLKPNVVKEVFNRLLFGKSLDGQLPPMNPVQLLVTLHTLQPPAGADDSVVITAMNLVLSMRSVYTKEIVSGVIQQLVEQSPPPLLLMRTITQALDLYPSLVGFLINVLQRLVQKEVWQWPELWVGFVAAAAAAEPHSFPVLLHLPQPQLADLLDKAPTSLRPHLAAHIAAFSTHQQSLVPRAVWEVVGLAAP